MSVATGVALWLNHCAVPGTACECHIISSFLLWPLMTLQRARSPGPCPTPAHVDQNPFASYNRISTIALLCPQSDAFYVPAKARMTFALGAAGFEDSGLSHEIVVPNLLGMVTDDKGRVDEFKAEYMLEPGTREYESQHMEEFLTPSGIKDGTFMLHPLKMSQKNASAHFWEWYAQQYSC